MFCGNCGQQIDEDSTFCPFCGAPVEKVMSGQEQVNTAVGGVIDQGFMDYGLRFSEVWGATVKGFGIGAIIGLLIAIWNVREAFDLMELLVYFPIFWFLSGVIISIIICSRNGSMEFLGVAALHVLGALKTMLFSFFTGGLIGLVIGFIILMIALLILIPIAVYMMVSYVLSFAYLGIMSLLEKKNKLAGKTELCIVLDKVISIAPIVITLLISIPFLKSML